MSKKILRFFKRFTSLAISFLMLFSTHTIVFAEGEEIQSDVYVAAYLNTDGITEISNVYQPGDAVDLSVRLGGGENQLGWSLEENGSTLVELTMPAEDITLYPVIQPITPSYTIRYYQEGLDDSYELVETLTVEADAGTMVSAASVQASENERNYAHFTFDADNSDGDQIVADDGSTVVSLYFSRNSYTLNFDINGNYRNVGDLYYATLRMNIDGSEYTGTDYSFTAKYGEDIHSKWPTSDHIVDNPYLVQQYSEYFGGWIDSNGTVHDNLSTLSDDVLSTAANGVVTLTAYWRRPSGGGGSSAPEVTITYNIYHQNAEDDSYTLHESIAKQALASALTTVAIDGYEGYTYSHYETVGEIQSVQYLDYSSWDYVTVQYYKENNVYFNRNSYTLNFDIAGETVRSETVRYGASLETYRTYEPDTKPEGRSELDGWYEKEIETMPAKDLTLTASWVYKPLETVTLSYDANGGSGMILDQIVGVDVYVRIADASGLTAGEGYHFNKWNTSADGSGSSYEQREILQLKANTKLYAMWERNHYTVIWEDEDGTVLEKDENVVHGSNPSYNSAEPLKDATAEYTYTFAGWSPQPGEVTGDVAYTAQYNAVKNTHSVTWVNYNGVLLEKDEQVEYGVTPTYDGAIPQKESTSEYTYTFIGWTPEIANVTGDITYTALFAEKAVVRPTETAKPSGRSGTGTGEQVKPVVPNTEIRGGDMQLNALWGVLAGAILTIGACIFYWKQRSSIE